jgi:hypothetical protein
MFLYDRGHRHRWSVFGYSHGVSCSLRRRHGACRRHRRGLDAGRI